MVLLGPFKVSAISDPIYELLAAPSHKESFDILFLSAGAYLADIGTVSTQHELHAASNTAKVSLAFLLISDNSRSFIASFVL